MSGTNPTLGLLAACGVICIWSGFIVLSRAGVLSALTPFDLTGLRFLVAGALTLPFAYKWWPRHLSLGQQAAIALMGPGILYTLLMYFGLEDASAAYGGVFANGSLPLFTLVLMFVFAGQRPRLQQGAGVAIIVIGGIVLAWRGMTAGGADVVTGIVLFLGASLVLAVYIIALGRWSVTPRQALALVNIPNAVLFLPLWVFALPSGLSEAPFSTIALQAVFQGLGPGFLAVIFFTLAAHHIGPTVTAGVSATVPATAAILAVPVLSEVPTPTEWLGIVMVSLGLLVLVTSR